MRLSKNTKVAFLNLSLDSFNHKNIWKKFFNGGDKETFNLYIHSKNKKCSVFKDHFIKNTVPTKWGQFSLVEATIEIPIAYPVIKQKNVVPLTFIQSK